MRVPFKERIDVSITPSSSSDIRRTEVDYLRANVAQSKPPPQDTTAIVDPTTLKREDT